MTRKVVSGITLILLLAGVVPLTSDFPRVNRNGQLAASDNLDFHAASQTIYIRADGSIDPPTALIKSADNFTYIFTGNISSPIVIERSDIVLDGKGYAVEGAGTDLSIGLFLSGVSNITIQNANVNDFYYGIYLHSVSHNVLFENNITDSRGFGIGLDGSLNNTIYENNLAHNGHGIWLENSSNNTVFRNNVSNNLKGIHIVISSDNTISGNVMNSNDYNFGITGSLPTDFMNSIDTSNLVNGASVYYLINRKNLSINPETYPRIGYLALVNSTNITVEGLTLRNNIQGLLVAFTNNSKISKNTIKDNSDGIWIGTSSNIDVLENNITRNTNYSLSLEYSSNNIIDRNIIFNNEGGVQLHSTYNLRISRNNITANVYDGLNLDGSSNNEITANIIASNEDGIDIWGSNNSIYENTVTTNRQYGIFLTGGLSRNILYGNDVIDNVYGVTLFWFYQNRICRNNITANHEYGLRLESSKSNTLCENLVSHNTLGIKLYYSHNNTIFHNDFLKNQKSVYNNGSRNNRWDDGYPSGGNYWSDYTGSDFFSGVYQNVTGSDGLGDTPYIIDKANQDNYPLMMLWASTAPVLNATVDINPTTLNLKSKGRWITAYIEFSQGYSVNDIDVSSVQLNDTISVELHPVSIGDYDKNTIPELMVKFNRSSVIAYISSVIGTPKGFRTVTITIMGKIKDGPPFQGSFVIRVI